VLPVIGAPLRGSPYSHWQPLFDARYRCGVIRDPGRTTVVTAGVGAGTVPLRLGAPPDFWLIEAGP
jgi:predicted MPP superfamily phosphohydrolase